MREPRGDQGWTRRDFARAAAGTAAVVALGSAGRVKASRPGEDSPLAEFCRSLTPEQRRALVLPFDDPRRTMIQPDWAVVPATIAALTADQQALALDLIRRACTPAGFVRLTRQRDDDAGGWKHDHLAVFGSPAEPDRCEWVLSGRHLTLHGTPTGAIRGPVFLGHAATGLGSLWHEVAERARCVPPAAGPDQRAVARELLAEWSGLFRAFEVPTLAARLDSADGFDRLTWEAFPDAWRLSGPGFRWSFHARPHAHSWFDVA